MWLAQVEISTLQIFMYDQINPTLRAPGMAHQVDIDVGFLFVCLV